MPVGSGRVAPRAVQPPTTRGRLWVECLCSSMMGRTCTCTGRRRELRGGGARRVGMGHRDSSCTSRAKDRLYRASALKRGPSLVYSSLISRPLKYLGLHGDHYDNLRSLQGRDCHGTVAGSVNGYKHAGGATFESALRVGELTTQLPLRSYKAGRRVSASFLTMHWRKAAAESQRDQTCSASQRHFCEARARTYSGAHMVEPRL
jgi:hypothetical protein